MQFKQSCNIEFSVEFVDGEQGKKWVADTTASLKNNYSETRTVKPTQNIHFTANFLMQFKQSCNIEFSVEFVDGEQGKKWVADTTASLKMLEDERTSLLRKRTLKKRT
ncbi:hypothetical protein ANCDUO_15166 [Ancylostoma duodenale]|uniref:Integrator complex subunit 7 C-terminal domain-containing protein n=1 Tax=Ancylostoma duodenale TaxID=51022 RepID=A0A0C2CXV8_9BILA|nr:hypothetical protein ANCDUO_15166 [Ancylostoma duodenale]